MSDFAGDFVLEPDKPEPSTSDSERERPWRIPNFEALDTPNLERHPVVERCIQAAARAWAEAYNAGQSHEFSRFMAECAYGAVMPDPVGEWNIHNFIACVAYGVHSHLIPQDEASRLLYAAQIALTGASQKRKPLNGRAEG